MDGVSLTELQVQRGQEEGEFSLELELEATAKPSSVQVQDALGVWTGAEKSRPARDKDLVLVAYES